MESSHIPSPSTGEAALRVSAVVRSPQGKGAARQLRLAESVPGVVYHRRQSQPISVPLREAERLMKQLAGRERLVELILEGQTRKVILKETQKTPYGNRLLHLDFHEVTLEKPIQVAVQVLPRGEAEGVRLGGMLQRVTREIQVRCLPTAIPQRLEVDVDSMQIGHSRHVADVPLPTGVALVTPGDTTLFIVSGRMVAEAEPGETEPQETDDA